MAAGRCNKNLILRRRAGGVSKDEITVSSWFETRKGAPHNEAYE
jgi:hypothetical protein